MGVDNRSEMKNCFACTAKWKIKPLHSILTGYGDTRCYQPRSGSSRTPAAIPPSALSIKAQTAAPLFSAVLPHCDHISSTPSRASGDRVMANIASTPNTYLSGEHVDPLSFNLTRNLSLDIRRATERQMLLAAARRKI